MYSGLGLHLQIRASPKNKFKLRGVHLNPHAKCRSSKFNLKLLKNKNGGHFKPGNTLIVNIIDFILEGTLFIVAALFYELKLYTILQIKFDRSVFQNAKTRCEFIKIWYICRTHFNLHTIILN